MPPKRSILRSRLGLSAPAAGPATWPTSFARLESATSSTAPSRWTSSTPRSRTGGSRPVHRALDAAHRPAPGVGDEVACCLEERCRRDRHRSARYPRDLTPTCASCKACVKSERMDESARHLRLLTETIAAVNSTL